ncbi:MAG TPA: hypothetical protein VFI13_07815, partial [Gemmatimonadales bacterium]|nr:hypothetical protein [Gemmatimonadales bacterium]
LGVVMGVTLGAFFGTYQAHSHPCRCDDPGLEPFEFAFLGGVVGGLVGGGLAEERRARAERRADSLAPARLMTENGTPLTGDSLRLVGKDHHGVRGGIAGGLMGGAVGFVVPHLAYALDHAHAGVDFGSTGTDHGPGTLPVLVSTATGALSGYLIAAALSRR